MTGFWEKVEVSRRTSTGPGRAANQRHHAEAAPGIGFRYVEELTDDRGDEDAERNCGEDIARERQRIERGEIGMDEADVIEQAVLQREGGRDDGNLRNNDQPLQPRITYVRAERTGK